ncbi:hypothetical protein JW979_15915, partial [bacterium]|nr:hypothetical protein [candidate division CSSED10-310 bacterium]
AMTAYNEVSQGFDGFDQALIGQAWNLIQMGEYSSTIEKSHLLLKNYLASNFAYEALVLSAHCKHILNESKDAAHSYRYVIRAHNAMSLQEEYDSERGQLKEQLKTLQELENNAIELRREELYLKINLAKDEIDGFMNQIQEKGDQGTILVQDYYDERLDILEHINQLDRVVDWASQNGREDVVDTALRQKSRLIKVLDIFQADRDVANTAYLVDFPLAAKEANINYRRNSISMTYNELDLEKRRIENVLETTSQMQDFFKNQATITDQWDLQVLQNDLDGLRDQTSRFRKWINSAIPDAPQSNMDYWADYAGVKLSELVFEARAQKLNEIDQHSSRLETIENILEFRRIDLQQQLDDFEQEIRTLQDHLLDKQIELEQLEKQTYFEHHYFDTRITEEEDWESRLRELLEQ